jgi:hypothetical protein
MAGQQGRTIEIAQEKARKSGLTLLGGSGQMMSLRLWDEM